MADKIEEPIIGDIVWYEAQRGVVPGIVTNVHRDNVEVLPHLDLLIPSSILTGQMSVPMTIFYAVAHGLEEGFWRYKGEQRSIREEAKRNDEAIYRELQSAYEALKRARDSSRRAPGYATRGWDYDALVRSVEKVLPPDRRS